MFNLKSKPWCERERWPYSAVFCSPITFAVLRRTDRWRDKLEPMELTWVAGSGTSVCLWTFAARHSDLGHYSTNSQDRFLLLLCFLVVLLESFSRSLLRSLHWYQISRAATVVCAQNAIVQREHYFILTILSSFLVQNFFTLDMELLQPSKL